MGWRGGVRRRSCVHVDAGSTLLRIGELMAPVVKQYNLVAAKAGGVKRHTKQLTGIGCSLEWRNRRSVPSDDRPIAREDITLHVQWMLQNAITDEETRVCESLSWLFLCTTLTLKPADHLAVTPLCMFWFLALYTLISYHRPITYTHVSIKINRNCMDRQTKSAYVKKKWKKQIEDIHWNMKHKSEHQTVCVHLHKHHICKNATHYRTWKYKPT